jgi:hypothetical protein
MNESKRSFLIKTDICFTSFVFQLVTICFLSLAISVGFSTAQEDTEEELFKFKEFKVLSK